MELRILSKKELNEHIQLLRNKERSLSLRLLECLIEAEERKLFLELGFSSLFQYCREELKYSESSACRRVSAARVLREYPEVRSCLEEGSITLVTLSLVSSHLTRENASSVFQEISWKSQREVQEFLSRQSPVCEIRERVRAVTVVKKFSPKALRLHSGGKDKVLESLPLVSAPVAVEERFELRFSVTAECREKLSRAQALLSGRLPKGASLEAVFEAGLDALLKEKTPVKSRTQIKSVSPRYIPVSVRREVRERDGGCCSFVSSEGKRCNSRWDLEYDHVVPAAVGGKSAVENVRLLCRAHNQFAAERFFGREFMRERVAAN